MRVLETYEKLEAENGLEVYRTLLQRIEEAIMEDRPTSGEFSDVDGKPL